MEITDKVIKFVQARNANFKKARDKRKAIRYQLFSMQTKLEQGKKFTAKEEKLLAKYLDQLGNEFFTIKNFSTSWDIGDPEFVRFETVRNINPREVGKQITLCLNDLDTAVNLSDFDRDLEKAIIEATAKHSDLQSNIAMHCAAVFIEVFEAYKGES